MAQGSLYTGYIKGRATAIKLGPNNPQIDSSTTQTYASRKFEIEKTTGVVSHPKVDGPARRVSTQPGRKVGSKMNINGGTF